MFIPPCQKTSILTMTCTQSPRADLAGRCSLEPRRANEHNLHLQWSARTKTAIENVRSWGVDLPPTFFSLCVLKIRWIGQCFSTKDFQVPRFLAWITWCSVVSAADQQTKHHPGWDRCVPPNCLTYKPQKNDELDNKNSRAFEISC